MQVERLTDGIDADLQEVSKSSGSGRRNLSEQIAALISDERIPVGTHLPTHALALRFKVLRWPVLQALNNLAGTGVVRYERDRGFFVAREQGALVHVPNGKDGALECAYFQVAADRLDGQNRRPYFRNLPARALPPHPRAARRASEPDQPGGWAERRSGYGWVFTEGANARHTRNMRCTHDAANDVLTGIVRVFLVVLGAT
jgi:Bacterial regulatory proteins, gntR family